MEEKHDASEQGGDGEGCCDCTEPNVTRLDVLSPATTAPPDDALMTREEVAAMLRVKPRQVQRLGVPCVQLGIKTKRYRRRDVEAWIQARAERR